MLGDALRFRVSSGLACGGGRCFGGCRVRRAGDDARVGGNVLGAGTTDSLLLQFLRGGLGLGCRLPCGLCRGLFLGGFSSLGLGDLLGVFLGDLLDCRLGGDGLGLFCGGVLARQGGTAGQGHGRFAGAACNLNRLVNPIGDGCEHLGVQRVEATLPLHRHGDDVCIAEDFKVL